MNTPGREQPRDLKLLEERRLRAARLFARKWTISEVARELGVSAQATSVWHKRWREGGAKALRSRANRGRKPCLTPQQRRVLQTELLKGAQAHGYATDLWTLERIQALLRRKFGVSRSVTQVWRIMRGMGWSCQKPMRRAKERNEKEIARWRREEWPRVKRGHNAEAL